MDSLRPGEHTADDDRRTVLTPVHSSVDAVAEMYAHLREEGAAKKSALLDAIDERR